MDKNEKGKSRETGFRAHNFPGLNQASQKATRRDMSAASGFQPLYKDAGGSSSYRPSDLQSAGGDPSLEEDTARRRRISYDDGLKAGAQDAHCLLQEEISPAMQAFKSSVHAFHQRLELITQASSHQVARLAGEIVRKILGRDLAPEDAQPDMLVDAILDAMTNAYRLNLRMNDADMAQLSAMLQCDPAFNMDQDAMRLDADAGLAKGTSFMEADDRKVDTTAMDQALDDLLNR